ncbi:MAG: type IV secretion protein IcmK [Gammaproteobacteria bacterium]|nr:MAG: type IV secretion protein IcmK [Gammaproteobacteria bacterium]
MTHVFKRTILFFLLTSVSTAWAQTITPPAGIPPEQFQQWLQNNGYAAGQTNNDTSAPPPSSAYEQGQQQMLNAVPPNSPDSNPEAAAAFQSMLQQNMPLTPRQVVQLHQQIDMSQRAAAIPANIPPKPVSTTLMVNLAPGTTPPAIRLAQGYVSSLVFVDSTGSPWPIAAFDIGNPKAVNIQWDGKSNIIMLQAVSTYSNGDIVLRLLGNPTPITLELVSGQRVVDYRVDIHVSGIGPNSKDLPIGSSLPSSANQLLLGVLDGVAPAGSKPLTVHGADAQAWLMVDKIYLRTRFTVLSPGWTDTMVSPDGMHAYELPKTSSVLISRYGEPAELKVEGF